MSNSVYALAVFVLLLTFAIMVCLAILGQEIAEETSEPQQYRIVTDQQYIMCGKGFEEPQQIARRFVPVPGRLYVNRNGYVYKCLRLTADGDAVMMRMSDGWLLTATGCRVYTDGQIEWDSSYDCRFAG